MGILTYMIYVHLTESVVRLLSVFILLKIITSVVELEIYIELIILHFQNLLLNTEEFMEFKLKFKKENLL